MIAASSLAFPGSKTLAAWARQLAPFQPTALWVGHLFVHRLEALAQIIRTESIEPLMLLLLKALDLELSLPESAPKDLPRRLDARLHLGLDVIAGLLRALETDGLCSSNAPVALTEVGRLAASTGGWPKRLWQRREFLFVERSRPDGVRQQPPHFVPLALDASPTWQPDDKTGFDLAWLRQCPDQTPAWKETFDFPANVLSIADPAANAAEGPPHWQRIVVDRPERSLVALIAVGPDPEKILGFSARQEGWELRSDRAILTLSVPAWRELADLAAKPDIAAWTAVWRAWCQSRQIPPDEMDECRIEQTGLRLTVHVSPALFRRLEAARSDMLKGDFWFLAGDGYLRSAVQVQVAMKPAS